MSNEDVARLEEQVKTLFTMIQSLADEVKQFKELLANRLPLWATMMFAGLFGALGWAAAVILK